MGELSRNRGNTPRVSPSPPFPHPPSSSRLLSFGFQTAKGECRARAFLAILSSPTTLFRSAPRRIPGWILRGMKKSPNSPVALSPSPSLPSLPPLKPLRFSCGSASHDLHMSCISRICIARFRFALDLSRSVIRRWCHCRARPPVSLPIGFSRIPQFMRDSLSPSLHIRPIRVDLLNN